MDWRRVTLTSQMTEAARIVSEAEVVIDFGETARGWFRVSVLEDLRAEDNAERYFARAVERDDPAVQALATGATPEDAASACLREAGVSLRRARESEAHSIVSSQPGPSARNALVQSSSDTPFTVCV